MQRVSRLLSAIDKRDHPVIVLIHRGDSDLQADFGGAFPGHGDDAGAIEIHFALRGKARALALGCDKDGQCKAFTYVKPGRTPYGECFLKNPVPEPSGSDCCISGVKGVGPASASAPAGARGAAASGPSYVGYVYETEFNDLIITSWSQNAATGRYEYGGGRIEGTLSGNVLTGYWLQEDSPLNCGVQRSGTPHFGRFTFTFNSDRTAFTGLWSDCEDAPSKTWNGRLVRREGAAASAGATGRAATSAQSRGNRQETVADRLAREAADEAEQRAREETRRGVRGLLNRVIRPE